MEVCSLGFLELSDMISYTLFHSGICAFFFAPMLGKAVQRKVGPRTKHWESSVVALQKKEIIPQERIWSTTSHRLSEVRMPQVVEEREEILTTASARIVDLCVWRDFERDTRVKCIVAHFVVFG